MTAPRPDVRLLADLDAGVLDEARAREVRAAADADPAARAVLDALTATRAALAASPDPPVPEALAARWSAALRAEQALLAASTTSTTTADGTAAPSRQPSTHRQAEPMRPQPTDPGTGTTARRPSPPEASLADPDPHVAAAVEAAEAPRWSRRGGRGGARGGSQRPSGRVPAARAALAAPKSSTFDGGDDSGPPRGRRALPRRPAVLAGVLLVAVLVGAGLLQARQEPPLVLDRPHLAAQALSTVGVRDTGGLDDGARRAACLRAVAAPGVRPGAPLLGGRRVTFEGTPGVLLVLGTGTLATFDVVIVDPACGNGGGTLVTATHVAPP